MLKRIVLFATAAVVAVAPAAVGLAGNSSLSSSVPVAPPTQAAVVDDHGGRSAAPGDDKTTTPTTAATPDDHGGLVARDDRVEVGDDRGAVPAPSATPDDHGGLVTRDDRTEAGDDRVPNDAPTSPSAVTDDGMHGGSGGGSGSGSGSARGRTTPRATTPGTTTAGMAATADEGTSGWPHRVGDVPPEVRWTTLSPGHGTGIAPEQRPVRTWRVFGQLVAAAAVVLVGVALLGLTASRRIAEQEAVNDAARRTDLVADAVVQPALRDGIVTSDPEATNALDAAVRGSVLGDEIVRVKVWDADGRIVYSDDDRLVGRVFPLGDDETAVLADPATEAEVSDLERPENVYERGQGKLLEVYRPVWTPDGTPLLFETYSRYDAVTERSTALWRGFSGITLTSLLLLVVLMLPVLWTLVDRLRRAQRNREVLLQHAVEASDEERRRIAATLHDGVVQELAASSFAIAGAAERAERSSAPELAEPLREAAGTVRASIKGLRSLLVDIYPASLQTSGLDAALADLVGGLESRGAAIDLELAADASDGLPVESQQVVYRVAQETLRNAVTHGHADRIVVRLTRDGDDVVLEVSDDGVGFDVHETLVAPHEGHFGLRLLSDVASSVGAELRVRSMPGEGTSWRLTVTRHE